MRTFNKQHDSLKQACAYLTSMLPKTIDGLSPSINLSYNEFEMAWGVELSFKERVWKMQIATVEQDWDGQITIPSKIPRQTRHIVYAVLRHKRKEILNSPMPWYESIKFHAGFKRGEIAVIKSGIARESGILPGGIAASYIAQYGKDVKMYVSLEDVTVDHPDLVVSESKLLEWKNAKNRKPQHKVNDEDPLLEQLHMPIIKPFDLDSN